MGRRDAALLVILLAAGLSTALFVMGRDKALSYWEKHRDSLDTILVEEDGSISVTEGLKDLHLT